MDFALRNPETLVAGYEALKERDFVHKARLVVNQLLHLLMLNRLLLLELLVVLLELLDQRQLTVGGL